MRVIDAPIIDYVFQPIADQLATFCDCFRLALIFANLAAITLLCDFLNITGWRFDRVAMGLDAAAIMLVVTVMFGYRHLIHLLAKVNRPGFSNPGRYTLLSTRLFADILTVKNAIDLILGFDDTFYRLFSIGFWGVSIYFSSCSKRPPLERSWRLVRTIAI